MDRPDGFAADLPYVRQAPGMEWIATPASDTAQDQKRLEDEKCWLNTDVHAASVAYSATSTTITPRPVASLNSGEPRAWAAHVRVGHPHRLWKSHDWKPGTGSGRGRFRFL